MSDASDTLLKKGLGARVTLRLSERELTAFKDLAKARDEDLTSIIREAIGAYPAPREGRGRPLRRAPAARR